MLFGTHVGEKSLIRVATMMFICSIFALVNIWTWRAHCKQSLKVLRDEFTSTPEQTYCFHVTSVPPV